MNNTVKQDIDFFVSTFKLTEELRNSSFVVTGATGLIGSTLVRCLLALKANIKIICPVRDINKAERLLYPEDDVREQLKFVDYDINNFDYDVIESVDYIIHCAAPTSSKFFVEHPVETFNAIVNGTTNILRFAMTHPVKGVVFLSSLEVYGELHNDNIAISENIQGYVNPLSVRSSYPIAKRAAENLCCLYANEYDIPVMIARLTQTTGAGVSQNDNRVITQFARLASQGKDIILHTTGESARPYCYTIDCISALLYILLKGTKGKAYNVANPSTYISVRDMAKYLRDNFNPAINIRYDLKQGEGYFPSTKQKLSTAELNAIGWTPFFGLSEIFTNIITYIKEEEKNSLQ